MFAFSKLLLPLALLTSSYSFSQNSNPLKFNVFSGSMIYIGDLTPYVYGNWHNKKPSFGIAVSKDINNYFTLRGEISKGNLNADEAVYRTIDWRKERAFSFTSNVIELNAQMLFTVAGTKNEAYQSKFKSYFGMGVGVAFLNTTTDYSKINTSYFSLQSPLMQGLPVDAVASKPNTILIFPATFGVNYSLNQQISLYTEVSYNLTMTDNIDGVKFSGNPNKTDNYYQAKIGLQFNFGKNYYNCPRK